MNSDLRCTRAVMYIDENGKLPERRTFFYHQVERFDGGEIGDRAKLNGREYYICKRDCRLEKGEYSSD